jgi:hypothetical protein
MFLSCLFLFLFSLSLLFGRALSLLAVDELLWADATRTFASGVLPEVASWWQTQLCPCTINSSVRVLFRRRLASDGPQQLLQGKRVKKEEEKEKKNISSIKISFFSFFF